MRVDLHAHTCRSPDGLTRPVELVERAREVGLDRVAVTDHGTLEGALEAQKLAPGLVIVGQEIRCRCRTELIGLFLRERVPDRLPLEEAARRIRAQGAVVYVPHPYAYAWRPGPRAQRALACADVVEAFNARAFLPAWNRSASRAARRLELPVGAGSDAHLPGEIGRAYTEMPAFDDATGFLAAAPAARAVGLRRSSALLHLVSAGCKVGRLLGARIPAPVPGRWRPSELGSRV